MTTFFLRKSLLLIALFTFISTSVSADIFLDRGSFEAATTGLATLDFEGIAPDGDFINPSPQPWLPSVFFSDATGSDTAIGIADSGFFFNTPTDALFLNEFDDEMFAMFGEDVTAVGFDVAIGFGGFGATVDVFGSDGGLLATSSFDTADETELSTFIGFSGLGEIASLVVTPDGGGFVLIDNFSYSNAVPEPTSAFLLACGSMLALVRRRR